MRSTHATVIPASNQIKTPAFSNSDTQGRIKTVPAAGSHLSNSYRSDNWVSMNLRRAAALALAGSYLIGCQRPPLGWYLVTPPPKKIANPHYHGWGTDTSATLSSWKLRSSYGTAEKCEQMRQELLVKGVAMTKTADPESNDYIIGQQLAEAECIATDDPRLKPN